MLHEVQMCPTPVKLNTARLSRKFAVTWHNHSLVKNDTVCRRNGQIPMATSWVNTTIAGVLIQVLQCLSYLSVVTAGNYRPLQHSHYVCFHVFVQLTIGLLVAYFIEESLCSNLQDLFSRIAH